MAPHPFLTDGTAAAPDGSAPNVVYLPRRLPAFDPTNGPVVEMLPIRASRLLARAAIWAIGIFCVGCFAGAILLGASAIRLALSVVGVRL